MHSVLRRLSYYFLFNHPFDSWLSEARQDSFFTNPSERESVREHAQVFIAATRFSVRRQIRINVRIRRLLRTKVDFGAQWLLGRRSGGSKWQSKGRKESSRSEGEWSLLGSEVRPVKLRGWRGQSLRWIKLRKGLAHLSSPPGQQKEARLSSLARLIENLHLAVKLAAPILSWIFW